MEPAKKKAVSLVIVVLILGGGAVFYFITNRALPPGQVVQSSFELLQAGDFDSLQQCYTSAVWRNFGPLLSKATKKDLKAIREHMSSLSSVQITEVRLQGDAALVEATLHFSSGASDIERFSLIRQSDGTWQID